MFSGVPSMGVIGQYWSNPFMEWFKDKHACAQNFHNYKDAVKACLKSSVNIAEDLISYSDESLLPTTMLTSEKETLIMPNTSWKKVYHEMFGVCYTFDARSWTR